jgi:hypothetical protein
LIAKRRAKLVDADRTIIREHKAEILARAEQGLALADRALQMLNRLKGYTIPSGQMPAARALAVQCEAWPIRVKYSVPCRTSSES